MPSSNLRINLYQPTKTSGLGLWLAADRITGLSNGAAVSQWDDVSGNARHATQATSGKRPTYQTNVANGRPVVRFDGVDDWLGANGVAASLGGTDKAHTIVAMLRISNLAGNPNLLSCGNSITGAFFGYGTSAASSNYVCQRVDDSALFAGFNEGRPDTNWHIITFRYNGTTLDQWIDGRKSIDVMALDVAATTLNRFTIGALGRTSEASYLTGDIAELAVYARALTNQEIAQLHQYFSHRYEQPLQNLGAPAVYTTAAITEVLLPRLASEVGASLGFNLQSHVANRWTLEKVKEAGATEARIQFSWDGVENMLGDLALSGASEQWLDWCSELELNPIIVAAYGPPRQQLLTVTVASDTPADTYFITVNEDISTVNPPYCHVLKTDNSHIVPESKWAYYGAFIHGVNTGTKTLELACKTNIDLPAGTPLRINQLLYASINSVSQSDPSVLAYCRYVRFLADRIAAHNLTGWVELWNEPIWAHDTWDGRPVWYDDAGTRNSAYPDRTRMTPDHEAILKNLFDDVMPANVRYDHAGTHKTGSANVLKQSPTQAQLEDSVISQSFHPYGDAPEVQGWLPIDYQANAGMSSGGNFRWAFRDVANARGTIGPNFYHRITETGLFTSDDNIQTRHVLRQFLFFNGLDCKKINFYSLAEASDYQFVNPSSQVPRRSYDQIQDLISNLNRIAGTPDASLTSKIPKVQNWNGNWPLMAIPILGAGLKLFWFSWQRTYGSPWQSVASPSPAEVYLTVQSGTAVVGAWNLVDGQDVTVQSVGEYLRYLVADDPVCLELELT